MTGKSFSLGSPPADVAVAYFCLFISGVRAALDVLTSESCAGSLALAVSLGQLPRGVTQLPGEVGFCKVRPPL